MTPEVKDTNPKDTAAIDRVPLSLVPTSATAEEAMAFLEGHNKYGAYNWRVAGVSVSIYIDAARRHLDKFWNGQDRDPGTRVHELASVRACCAIIIDAMQSGCITDDRPPKQNQQDHHKRLEEIVKHLNSLYPAGPGRYTEVAQQQKGGVKPVMVIPTDKHPLN